MNKNEPDLGVNYPCDATRPYSFSLDLEKQISWREEHTARYILYIIISAQCYSVIFN